MAALACCAATLALRLEGWLQLGASLAAASLLGFAVWLRLANGPVDDKPGRRLRVVITGSTRGVGFGLARCFAELGDQVLVCGRSTDSVDKAVHDLRDLIAGGAACVAGCVCDVTNADQVEALGKAAQRVMGGVDLWIANAGCTHKLGPLRQVPPDELERVVAVNSLGMILTARCALGVMHQQGFGHLVLVGGAGTTGMSTATFAGYGYSKAGHMQLMASLHKEMAGTGVGVHVMTPGMVITDLLMRSDEDQDEAAIKRRHWVFNVLAELPSTSAAWTVPRLRGLVTARGFAAGSAGDQALVNDAKRAAAARTAPLSRGRVAYLTPFGVVARFALHFLLGFGKDRLIDQHGRLVQTDAQ